MNTFLQAGQRGLRAVSAGAALALALAMGAGCKRPPPAASAPVALAYDGVQFDGQRAFAELKDLLALGLRDSGTPGAEAAAKHLAARLQAAGVEARIDEFTESSPCGSTVYRNVIGRLPGTGEGLILLCSHYDTKSGMPAGFEGANDSGSSSAAVLELARMMAKGPSVPPEIWFVFFDGEECMEHYGPGDGLRGSDHLAQQLVREGRANQVRGVILLDMIGDKDLSVTLPRNSTPALAAAVFEAARAENARSKFSLYPYEVGDDHEPFFLRGMPAVDIIDFQYGSQPGANDYWHNAEDRIDKISPDSLATIGRVVVRVVNGLIATPASTAR